MQSTILLVDDTASMRHLLRRAITRGQPDIPILEAATVQDALHLLAQHHITALITDYHLPDGEGSSIVQAARRHDPTMLVFVVSADANVAARVRALGATAFFAKPLDMQALVEAFEQLV